jgi:hypothetical protein
MTDKFNIMKTNVQNIFKKLITDPNNNTKIL